MYFPLSKLIFLILLVHAFHNMARAVQSRIPYDSHPLYGLRRGILIAACIGVFLNLGVILNLASSSYGHWRLPIFVFATFLLSASIAFVSYDLLTYGARQAVVIASRPNVTDVTMSVTQVAGQTWPSKALLVWDIILAILLQWLFWGALADIAGNNYYDRYRRSETVEACKRMHRDFMFAHSALSYQFASTALNTCVYLREPPLTCISL